MLQEVVNKISWNSLQWKSRYFVATYFWFIFLLFKTITLIEVRKLLRELYFRYFRPIRRFFIFIMHPFKCNTFESNADKMDLRADFSFPNLIPFLISSVHFLLLSRRNSLVNLTQRCSNVNWPFIKLQRYKRLHWKGKSCGRVSIMANERHKWPV